MGNRLKYLRKYLRLTQSQFFVTRRSPVQVWLAALKRKPTNYLVFNNLGFRFHLRDLQFID